MSPTVVRENKLLLKGSPLSGENPQPLFRQPDPKAAYGQNFPEDKKYSFGRETGFRILPYTMQNRYGRELADMEFPSIIMENDFLKAEFIPALGGRLWSLFDKKRNRNILYKNPVFRPANLAIRDAWFSGGIEWNIGRYGHTVHTCSPVFAGIINTGDGKILRLWEFERQTRLFWRIEFSLPEDSSSLIAYFRVENPDNYEKCLYSWINAAVPQTPGVRVFSATDEVIYIIPETGKLKTMDYGRMPYLPVLPGKDSSYPSLFDYSNEYFYQNDRTCDENNLPWEAAVYEDGFSYGEMSTPPLLYRKMFCWGNGRGGRQWQKFLTLDGGDYLELQAGLAPTQLHTADIAACGVVDWVQAFTAFEADPEKSHQKDYNAASDYVAVCLKKQIDSAQLKNALNHGRDRAHDEAEVFNMGSGWGALERKLQNKQTAPGLSFPDESIGETEEPWVELLRKGLLPRAGQGKSPGSFIVDKAWKQLLMSSAVREGDWFTPYHLGVISFETGDSGEAVSFWEESLKQKENPWACRNLAQANICAGNIQGALDYYRRALCFPESQEQSFAEEYIPLLLSVGKWEDAWTELNDFLNRAGSLKELSVNLMDAAARIALYRGDNTLLDKIFSIEHTHIREGNNSLVEIWKEREILRLESGGLSKEQAAHLLQKKLADGSLVVPKEIDFRMYSRETTAAQNISL